MRRWLTVAAAGAAVVMASGVAQGQTRITEDPKGYAGIVAESAFGNVTSQSFGAEAGYAVTPQFVIFIEGGRVMDAAPSSLGQGAQIIAVALGVANVTYAVKEPINFFATGVKYMIPTGTKFEPYLLAGGGVGMAKPDAEFSIAGVNVNDRLAQFGVVLGADLSGTSTAAMMEVGGGVVFLLPHVYFDLGARYNRLFTDAAIPFGRVGLGFGFRF